MIQPASEPVSQQLNRKDGQVVPAFRPVALPALAAAVQASKTQQKFQKNPELPAILRKEAVLG